MWDLLAVALRAGANDLGGTLMSESISRAAGAAHGLSHVQDLGEHPDIRSTGAPPFALASSSTPGRAMTRTMRRATRERAVVPALLETNLAALWTASAENHRASERACGLR